MVKHNFICKNKIIITLFIIPDLLDDFTKKMIINHIYKFITNNHENPKIAPQANLGEKPMFKCSSGQLSS